jgi:CubicO group peptidase (beta-lactamase class C family)
VSALDAIADWPVDHAAAAVIGPSGVLASFGDQGRQFPLASVTKLLAARAAHVAVEEGVFELDTPAGPPGSTIRHLLAHASGLGMHAGDRLNEPGHRRVYSNYGFQVMAEALGDGSGIAFDRYLHDAVFAPLGMSDSMVDGGAAASGYGGVSTVADLVLFAGELLRPELVAPSTHDEARTVQFPGLDGVLPGFGVQRPNDWGQGFEIRDDKSPHWTGSKNSQATYGHFGQSGTCLWVDPHADLALVVLTDRDFGDWARERWPGFSDTVLAEFAGD